MAEMAVADYVLRSPILRSSDPEVETRYQGPVHIPAHASTAVSFYRMK